MLFRSIWVLALRHMDGWSSLVGHGLGAWRQEIPRWQEIDHVRDQITGRFHQAHNEYMQVFYELGAIGLGSVVMWFRSQWAAIERSPYVGSVIALMICSVGMFQFHVVTLAVLSIVVLGLATLSPDERSNLCLPS